MGNYEILNLNDAVKWALLINKLPIEQQDIYFTPGYYQLYENYGDGIVKCFVFEKDGEIALYPFLINSVNELGYDLDDHYYDIQGAYGYNGIVSSTYDDVFISAFFAAFKNYIHKNHIIAEFTRFQPILENHKFSIDFLDVLYDRNVVVVDLSNFEDTYNQFSSSAIRGIRKAEKEGIEIEYLEKAHKKEDFFKLYIETMKRVNSQQALFFNEKYFNDLFSLTELVQFCAVYRNQVIASTICFKSQKYLHYHLGCSSNDFLQLRPNNILFNEMIKFGCDNKFKKLHLGGGSDKRPENSLLRFKKNFSYTLQPFYIGKKIHNKKIYEEVVKQWSYKCPEKTEMYKNFALKYRY